MEQKSSFECCNVPKRKAGGWGVGVGDKSPRSSRFGDSPILWELLKVSHPIPISLLFWTAEPQLCLPSGESIPLQASVHLIGGSWEGVQFQSTQQPQELPFLLVSLLFDKQEGCLITESRLKWSFYLDSFAKRIKFGLPLKKRKRVASFLLLSCSIGLFFFFS